jgi:hypothetical protein
VLNNFPPRANESTPGDPRGTPHAVPWPLPHTHKKGPRVPTHIPSRAGWPACFPLALAELPRNAPGQDAWSQALQLAGPEGSPALRASAHRAKIQTSRSSSAYAWR